MFKAVMTKYVRRFLPARGRKSIASGSVVVLSSAALIAAAVTAEGFHNQQTVARDGAVWVVNPTKGLVARVNTQVNKLDGAIGFTTDRSEVFQQGDVVVAYDTKGSKLATVNVRSLQSSSPAKVPKDASVAFGGVAGQELIALVDPKGAVFALHAGDLASFDVDKAVPMLTASAGAQAVVSSTGTLFVLDGVHGSVLRIPAADVDRANRAASAAADASKTKEPSSTTEASTTTDPKAPAADEFVLKPTIEKLGDGAEVSNGQLTVVGEVPVVLDVTRSRLVWPGSKAVDVLSLGSGLVLQQAAPVRDSVVVASDSSLAMVGLGGDHKVTVLSPAGIGSAARPAVAGTCVVAAWAGSDTSAKPLRALSCPGSQTATGALPEGVGGVPLTIRVNHEYYAFNDAEGRTMSMDLKAITNWDEVQPKIEQDNQTDESTDNAPTEADAKPDRTGKNEPPVAADDTIGVRPGRSSMLDVLANDQDRNGDVLTVKSFTPVPADVGTVVSVNGGQTLQFTPAAGRTDGVAEFTYIITDGVEGSQSQPATVALSIHPFSVNGAPVPRKGRNPSKTTARAGDPKGVVHDVLADWTDPDGDVLTLKSAKAENASDTVRFTPAGSVTFFGQQKGDAFASFTVSDGRETATGRLQVTVTDQNVAPKARNDLAVGFVGQAIVVRPLANDTDPNGDELRLVSVAPDSVPGADVRFDSVAGTVTVKATEARTIIFDYKVADTPENGSSATSDGVVRIDVVAKGTGGAPIAVLDSTVVTVGRPTLVDVLANDVDPDGDVLVVESAATVDTQPNVAVAVVENRSVRVLVASRQIDDGAPVVIAYRITDGKNEVDGNLVVQTIDPPEKDQPPIVRADSATVRAGDVVTVRVLANDLDPEGGPLRLGASSVALTSAGGTGTLFASGSAVRFVAPAKPGTVTGTYAAFDESGQNEGAPVTFNVKALPTDPAKDDLPPQPLPLEARGFAGAKAITIAVPLDGVDPDGDSVHLSGASGQGSVAPKFGRLAESKDGRSLVYEPDRAFTGTEEFTYALADTFGKSGEATVRLGIAPRPERNRPPVATDDKVTVRPGIRIAVPVLANDTDPDGDALSLVGDSLTAQPAGAAPDLAVGEANTVTLTAPAAAGTSFVTYSASDGKGGQATASLTIITDSNATGLAPTPQDDDSRAANLQPNQATLSVDVLANDTDPDSPKSELVVGLPQGQDAALAQVSGGSIMFALVDREQVLAYTLTDAQGNVGTAVVHLPAKRDPAKDNKAPELRPGAAVTTKFGEPVDIDVNALAVDPEGQQLHLTSSSKVSATHAASPEMVLNETTLRFTPEGNYAGQAAITFEVADGTLPADGGTGKAATLTVPITVLPKDNQPPTARPGMMSPGVGDPAVTLDLRQLVDDPDADDVPRLKITEPKGDPAGMKVTFADGVLSVEAPTSVKKGTATKLTYAVTDGKSDPVSSTIDIVVQRSTQPLAKAVADTFPGKLTRGKPATIQPLVNDFNPFAAQNKPLKIIDVQVPVAQGVVSTDGAAVTFTPDSAFVGTAAIRYQVQDATTDPDRQVWGDISGSVIGVPDVPQPPSIASTSSKTVVLQWLAPAANGSNISSYLVQTYEGGAKVGSPASASSTTASITGLVNAHTYTFTVVAQNEAGPSSESAQSSAAVPDEKLPKMTGPGLTFVPATSGRLDVAWTAPDTSNGSAAQQFELDVAPPPTGYGGAYALAPTALTYTANGLTNGTAYRFRIRVKNGAGWSDWSDYSTPETPSAVPDPVAAPGGTRVNDPLGGRINVTWAEPSINGAAVTAYTIEVSKGGAVEKEVPVATAATSQEVTVAQLGANYQFRLKATNRSGTGTYGALSPAVVNYAAPDAIGSVSATPGNGQVTLAFADPPNNGQALAKYIARIYVNGSLFRTDTMSVGQRVLGALVNGTAYSFDVTAWNTYPAAAASPQSGAVIPFGPPPAPSVSTSKPSPTTVRFDWAPTGNNGNALTDIQYSLNGGGWTSAGPNPNGITVGNGYSQSFTVAVRAVNAAGPGPQSGTVANTTDNPPPPPNFTFTFNENPFHCNGGSRSTLGVLYGAAAGETISFSSTDPTVVGLRSGAAQPNGTLALAWQCVASDIGRTVPVTAHGATSGITTTFFVSQIA